MVAAVVVAGAAIFILYGNRSRNSEDDTLVWGGGKNISMLPIIANKKGFFREVGLNVSAQYVQTGKIAMDAVISGDLDFGVVVETNLAFIKFQRGADPEVIASIAEKYDDAIVARRDLGIQEPKDLQGKKLAILPGTTSQLFADRFIDFYKLNRQEIEFVNLSPPSIQASIINGQIPAGSIWQPFRYNVAREIGRNAVQFTERQIYKSYVLIAVRPEFAKQRPQKILLFLKGLIKAEEFVRANPQEAIEILATEIGVDPKILAAVWEEYDLSVGLDVSLVEILAQEGAWIHKTQKGFENMQVPSYRDVLNFRFLEQVDAARVDKSEP